MKRQSLLQHVLLPVLCLLFTVTAPAATPAAGDRPVLTVVNWEEWLAPDVIQSFEKKENVKVQVLTFDNIDNGLKLLEKNAGKVDIFVGGSVQVSELKARKQLARLDRTQLPNMKHMLPRFNTDPDYAVPYLWGYTGIVYRTDRVKTPIRTYAQLFALAGQNPGKVSLMSDSLEFAWAVLWGTGTASPDPESPVQLQAAMDKFRDTRAAQMVLHDVDYAPDNPLASGALIAAQVYSDYATFLSLEQHVPVAYVNPDDVCIIWQDNLMLMAKAPHPELAMRLMNYLSDARIAARNAMAVKSTAANPLAMQYYDEAYRNNPVIRPGFEGTERCRVYGVQTPAARQFYETLKPASLFTAKP